MTLFTLYRNRKIYKIQRILFQYISALKIDYKFEYTLDQGNTEVDSKRISQCLGMFESSMLRKCANIPLRN